MALQQQHCEACRADAPRISDEEADKLRGEIPDWKHCLLYTSPSPRDS